MPRVDQVVVSPLLNRVHVEPVERVSLVRSGVGVVSQVNIDVSERAPDEYRLICAKINLNGNRVVNPSITRSTQRCQIRLSCVVRCHQQGVVLRDCRLVDIGVAIRCRTSRHGQVELQTHRLNQLVAVIINLHFTPSTTNVGTICSFARARPEGDNRLLSPVLLAKIRRFTRGTTPDQFIVIRNDKRRHGFHTRPFRILLTNEE